MGKYWGRGLAAAALALGAHVAWAQGVAACPDGQVMQRWDPSGKNLICVAIPNTAALQQQIADEAATRGAADNGLQQQINNEVAARKAADAALDARIDTLTERDIVGKWSVSGTTNCLQSSTGFTTELNPLFPPPGSTAFVSQLAGTFIGTRTFELGGTGRTVGTTHALFFPGTFHGQSFPAPPGSPQPPPFFAGVGSNPPAGGASLATLDAGFTWQIESDGRLRIDDENPVEQPITAPPSRLGWTATIENHPPYVGYISKDRRTIVLTHPGMQVEVSTTRDTGQNVIGTPSSRFCARHRVLTRLD